ncbi:MAG TPA: hypothetical protein VNW71_19215, partial [Thermoanaerobaculia bacterium]|nr:hypothetical protein [Thermoanaerobaculia bacterium]
MDRPRDSRPGTRAIAEAKDSAALQAAMASIDLEKLTANDYSVLSKALQGKPAQPDLKLAILGNFTLDLLPRYVDVHCAREGLRSAFYVGKFGQYVQEVLDESSEI